MSHPTTAFFHPSRPTVRTGFRVDDLYEAKSQEVRQGLLLGSAHSVPASEAGKPCTVKRARTGSQVVWTLNGEPLPTERGFLTHASVVSMSTERGGTRHLLTRDLGSGRHLVLVQTGLVGSKDDHIRQILEHAHHGNLPVLHGSMAYDDGSRALSGAVDDGELTDVMDDHQSSLRHLRWWRPRTTLPGTDRIRARVMDLWEMSPGAELLVGDITPGREHRIVIRNGQVCAVDAPAHARDLLEEAFAKRARTSNSSPSLPEEAVEEGLVSA